MRERKGILGFLRITFGITCLVEGALAGFRVARALAITREKAAPLGLRFGPSPRLVPPGKWPAYGLPGRVWGLWRAPLVRLHCPGAPAPGVRMMALPATARAIWMNIRTLRYQSVLLACRTHGIWRALPFADTHPLLGGITVLRARPAGPAIAALAR